MRRLAVAVAALVALSIAPRAAVPIVYTFSFPEPQHRWMQVEAAFADLDATPLELRMSRSSPGRYSLHDFAKNVYDVHVRDAQGRELDVTRPDASGWTVPSHGASVTVSYKVYGDTLDGTYLAIDTTHAHINMPAAIMCARGLDDRPSTLTFVPPTGANWRVATQLHPVSNADSRTPRPELFSAPNLQYLMDSPVEFGPIAIREFVVAGRRFRFALHHQGTDADLDAYVNDVAKIVAQEGAVFGEFPDYEPGAYTFLADYLPYARGDGMEHRNSTVMTGAAALRNRGERDQMLGTVSHEFFHSWNVERIRPRSLEPFDFERANTSGELWLAEGFTQYYGDLLLARAGLVDTAAALAMLAQNVDQVLASPARAFRSAVDMSRMAPFIDGGHPVDRTNWSSTVVSYYPYGGAIALALDLALRERTDGATTLDDYMRAMWRVHGRPGGSREGYVDRPYTLADAEARLVEVSRDATFAHDFFARFITGRELPAFADLLAGAGVVLRRRSASQAWLGDVRFESRSGVRVASLVEIGSPAYAAGLEEDDVVKMFDGERMSSAEEVQTVLRRHRPGDRVDVTYTDRRGVDVKTAVTLGGNPHIELVPAEAAGIALTPSQRSVRDAWLGPAPARPTTQPQPR